MAKANRKPKNVIKLDEYRTDLVQRHIIEKMIETKRFRAVTIVGLPFDKRENPTVINYYKGEKDANKLMDLMDVAAESIIERYGQ